MIRSAVGQHIIGQQVDHDPNFRWRGDGVTRIENLSDIAFAVALGMIISGVDAPRTFDDLIRFLIYSVPAAAAFAVLIEIWMSHYTFFRRYGSADRRIIIYNAILIFLVLYMAYPLRFAFDSFYGWVMAMTTGDISRNVEIGVMNFETSGKIIALFGAIYGCAYVILALMYGYIGRKRADDLALDSNEVAITRQDTFTKWCQAGLAFMVALLGYFTPLNGMAGFLLCLNSLPRLFAKRVYPLSNPAAP